MCQAGQPSITTVSSYDEVHTPRSSRSPEGYDVEYFSKQVEGPRGPHLFRSSTISSFDEDVILTLSPITPKAPRGINDFINQPPLPQPPAPQQTGPFQYTYEELDTSTLASWTPEMVAQSMLDAGIEPSMADRFIENDINGPLLITLKFEDLRELDIKSFGIRTRVWQQIQALRDSRPASPSAETPIENVPSPELHPEVRRKESPPMRRGPSVRRRQPGHLSGNDVTPMESVSIIGIEQVIPKPHYCEKGENCSRWRKQQQLIQSFKKENPNVDLNTVGTIMIAGDVGNAETAKALDPNETLRPYSEATQSIVASSDVLGPGGLPPLQYLQEATLRSLQKTDPQDNVRQFLSFQQHQLRNVSDEVPPTPPYFDVNPPTQAPHHGLRRLPKLAIPGTPVAPRPALPRAASVPPQTQQPVKQQAPVQQNDFVPYRMERVNAMASDFEPSKVPYRFGTPFSEVDVPLTTVPLGPVARDHSQSVPPDMSFRSSPVKNTVNRSQSRASARRPSFPVLPALEENKIMPAAGRATPKAPSPKSPRASVRQQQPLQAPPRVNYPWSPVERASSDKSFPSLSSVVNETPAADPAKGISHQGPMKKRKTRLLRHEWNDGYFTLKGTRLNMHKDAKEIDRTLEYVDIDDYAIACSSVASTSKLSAAFKAVHISHNREKSDPVAAFAFQLVPQDKNALKQRKRDSTLPGANGASAEGVNGTGKTHHFAVKNRDDRIDWMRELMLAKALKQKGEGFEISVNGNMI